MDSDDIDGETRCDARPGAFQEPLRQFYRNEGEQRSLGGHQGQAQCEQGGGMKSLRRLHGVDLIRPQNQPEPGQAAHYQQRASDEYDRGSRRGRSHRPALGHAWQGYFSAIHSRTAWVVLMPRRSAGMALNRARMASADRPTLSGIQVAERRPAAVAAVCSARTVCTAPRNSPISRRVSGRNRAVGLRGMPFAVVRNSCTVMARAVPATSDRAKAPAMILVFIDPLRTRGPD